MPSNPSSQQQSYSPQTSPATPSPSSEPSSSSSPAQSSTAPCHDSYFECNVCFDVPTDPVLTPCGHLFCWSHLYRWMQLHPDSPQCPVCKSGISKQTVIPIYGRGRTHNDDPRERSEEVPPRPRGHRAPPLQQTPDRLWHAQPTIGMHHTFGRMNPYGANYEDVSLSTFGLFPSLRFQIAYPQVNEQPREEPQANQDDGMSDLGALLCSFKYFPYVTVRKRVSCVACVAPC